MEEGKEWREERRGGGMEGMREKERWRKGRIHTKE